MKRIYEFVCECGQRTESLVIYEVTEIECICGRLASRIVSAPSFNLEGWSGHFPSAYERFESRHTEKLKAERKANS